MRIWALCLLTLIACGDSKPNVSPDASGTPDTTMGDADPGAVGDILDELNKIPGMTAVEGMTMTAGYRFFQMQYEQPVDHKNPGGAHFTQRMTLMYRNYAAPMVVYNSGYFVSYTRGSRSQVTQLVDGNQLSMEYRYFEPSRPDPADWTKLDIEQAANDQHRITQVLQARLFQGKWLTTGASKGGMTSLFHRRFFPDDVDGTVAFVAPIDYPEDAVQSPTNRFFVFLENVGTDPTCRQKLKDFQNLALARRDAMKTRMRMAATYTAILGEDRALEFAVEELPFIFWQYGSQSQCSKIPANTATDDAVFKFLDDTIDVTSYGDADLTDYLPYYHQSATQLGYPISDESYLVGLMYPGGDTAQAYVPSSIPAPVYDNGTAMHDFQDWLSASGEHILLIYGQNDPWSAGQATLGNATDSFKFIAPNGNHGSGIATLNADDEATATAAVMRWAGLAMKKAKPLGLERTTEQDELALRRRR
ncbi:MAG TPA: S28 family serine protease [Kofleriaceae bacterium]|nr:S28 family serine protease [Kofleriaceae bacterium]